MIEYCTKGWVILGESKPALGSNYTKVFVFYIKKRQLTLYFCKFTFGNHKKNLYVYHCCLYTAREHSAKFACEYLRKPTLKNNYKF